MLTSFMVGNYRAFARSQQVDVARLTLLYGKNGAGKSALLRALPWMDACLHDQLPGPTLQAESLRGATWEEIVHHRTPSQPVELAISWTDPDGAAALRVEAVPVHPPSGRPGASREVRRVHRVDIDGECAGFEPADMSGEPVSGDAVARTIRGILPFDVSLPSPRAVARVRALADATRVQWIQSVRQPPERLICGASAPPDALDSKGANAAHQLRAWARDGGDASAVALGVIDPFFAAFGLRLRTTEGHRGFSVEVEATSGAAINLRDAGDGLAQVLPVLVALGRAASGEGPSVVAVEQPELHLHADAQRALAATMIQVVGTPGSRVQVVCEAHSEVLLAAVQVAVASGQLKAEEVALHWVHADDGGLGGVAQRVHLDAQGRFDGHWPLDAFDDLLQLRGQLHRARLGSR